MPSICPSCDAWRTEEPHRLLPPHGACLQQGLIGETFAEAVKRRQGTAIGHAEAPYPQREDEKEKRDMEPRRHHPGNAEEHQRQHDGCTCPYTHEDVNGVRCSGNCCE